MNKLILHFFVFIYIFTLSACCSIACKTGNECIDGHCLPKCKTGSSRIKGKSVEIAQCNENKICERMVKGKLEILKTINDSIDNSKQDGAQQIAISDARLLAEKISKSDHLPHQICRHSFYGKITCAQTSDIFSELSGNFGSRLVGDLERIAESVPNNKNFDTLIDCGYGRWAMANEGAECEDNCDADDNVVSNGLQNAISNMCMDASQMTPANSPRTFESGLPSMLGMCGEAIPVQSDAINLIQKSTEYVSRVAEACGANQITSSPSVAEGSDDDSTSTTGSITKDTKDNDDGTSTETITSTTTTTSTDANNNTTSTTTTITTTVTTNNATGDLVSVTGTITTSVSHTLADGGTISIDTSGSGLSYDASTNTYTNGTYNPQDGSWNFSDPIAANNPDHGTDDWIEGDDWSFIRNKYKEDEGLPYGGQQGFYRLQIGDTTISKVSGGMTDVGTQGTEAVVVSHGGSTSSQSFGGGTKYIPDCSDPLSCTDTCKSVIDSWSPIEEQCFQQISGDPLRCELFNQAATCCANSSIVSVNPGLVIPNPDGDLTCANADKNEMQKNLCEKQCSVASTQTDCKESCMSEKRWALGSFSLIDMFCSYAISDNCYSVDNLNLPQKPTIKPGSTPTASNIFLRGRICSSVLCDR